MFPVLKSYESGTSSECSDAETRQSEVMWEQYIV
jgi:hypothetical protein